MKAQLLSLIAVTALVLLPFCSTVRADDKVITITGMAKCTKCQLHETDKCGSAITAKEDGKKVTYYCDANDVCKNFHENICESAKKVTATGTVKEVDGKKILVLSKIELAK